MCLGILPALLILYVRSRVEDPEVFQRGAQRERDEVPLKQILSGELLKTTIAASLLATGIQGGYYAMFTWIPTYLKTERDLTVVGTQRLPVRGHRGLVPRLPDAPGWVHDRLGRRRDVRAVRGAGGRVAGRCTSLVPSGLEHDAAARRLPARLLRLRLLLGLRLLPGRAVPDAGARRPAGASVTTSAAASGRCSRASSASSRRRSGSAGRSPSACSATCSRSARWRCCRRRTGASSARVE